ncbi:hypothetical protein RvY_14877 [Ramazzottius varieornatus]|uniref:Uncharacterized protein n=1 Tax=Ramazzottius varieornatus TaxID=947166 RepID=A0A1D1VUJ3_RAMVA|nr:hypothetical protein RvY_14877 [Ramazzottius varieornatus]
MMASAKIRFRVPGDRHPTTLLIRHRKKRGPRSEPCGMPLKDGIDEGSFGDGDHTILHGRGGKELSRAPLTKPVLMVRQEGLSLQKCTKSSGNHSFQNFGQVMKEGDGPPAGTLGTVERAFRDGRDVRSLPTARKNT